MKNILISMIALALLVPVPLNVYCQTGEEGLVSQQMRGMQQSAFNNLQGQKPSIITSDFLKTVNAPSPSYEDTPLEKGGVGTINALTAWTEIPKQIVAVSDQDSILAGLTYGFSKGFVTGMGRGFAGLYDMATFGMPPYDKPAVKPEYKVNNPQRNGLKLTVFRW